MRTQLLLFGVIHGLLALFLWGAFAPAWAQDVCSYRAVDSLVVVDVLIDDFDRDGFNDFAARADRNVPATFQPANGRVTIFLNNTTIPATQTPAGLFGGGVAYDPGVEASSTSGPFASADFDGDSFPDLVFITPDPVYNFFGNPVLRYSVLFNSSAAPGTFPTSTAGLIAPPGSLSFYGYQNHTGLDVVASDFDGDGISDFAVVHGDLGNPAANDLLQVYSSDGFGNFTALAPLIVGEPAPRGGDARDVRLGDVDGDGDLDVGVLYRTRDAQGAPDMGSGLSIFINTPTGLLPAENYPAPVGPTFRVLLEKFALADSNGDGLDDYVAVGAYDPLPSGPQFPTYDFSSVMPSTGLPGGLFTGLTAFDNMPSFPLDMASSDLDGDGDDDFVVSTPHNGPGNPPIQNPGFTLLASDGIGSFSPAPPLAPFIPLAPIGAMALGDMDGRQLGDLVISSPSDSLASGVPSPVVNLVLGRAACPLDINCDGSVDQFDVALLLSLFGTPCPVGGNCRGDLDGDGGFGPGDLPFLLPTAIPGSICP